MTTRTTNGCTNPKHPARLKPVSGSGLVVRPFSFFLEIIMCVFDCCQDNDTAVDTLDIDPIEIIIEAEANGLEDNFAFYGSPPPKEALDGFR